MLVLLGSALIVVALTAGIAYLARYGQNPQRLYEEIHEKASTHYFDPARMRDWQSWKERFAGQILSEADGVRYANEMLAALNDPFTVAIGPQKTSNWRKEEPEFVNLGVTVATAYEDTDAESCQQSSALSGYSCQYPTITSVGAESPAHQAGLKAGDVITSIDAVSTAGQSRRYVQDRLRGLMGTSVVLEVESKGRKHTVTMVRTFVRRCTALARMLDSEIGYLNIAHFASGAEDAALEQAIKLEAARAIIVDLRNNPGGAYYCGVRTAALFIKEGIIARMQSRLPGPLEAPQFVNAILRLKHDRFLWEEVVTEAGDNQASMQASTDRRKVARAFLAGKPVIVLVNGNTASAAETFAGALRDTAGATILGSRTFGKGVGQQTYRVGYRVALKITTFKSFLPSGFWPGDAGSDRRGIEPDVRAPMQVTLFDFGSEQDEHLQMAVELLKASLC